MAILLEDKQNVNAPNATFPFGDVKDNSGANDGTPLNRAVLSDYMQFFAKMLDASGVVANGLLESESDGFQYFEALIANVRATSASLTEKGTSERATQAEVNAGTDTERHIVPARIAGATDIITNQAIQDDAVDNDKIADGSIDGPKIVNGEVSTAKLDDGAVTNIKLDDNSVSLAKMQNDSVDTPELVDLAVEEAKLGTTSVSTAKIQNDAVTSQKVTDKINTNQTGLFNFDSCTQTGFWYYDGGGTINDPPSLNDDALGILLVARNQAAEDYAANGLIQVFIGVDAGDSVATNGVFIRWNLAGAWTGWVTIS